MKGTAFLEAAMARSSAAAVAAIISVLCTCINGQYPPDNDLIGLECGPPFGYLRHVCGPEIFLEEDIEPVPDYLHG
jgi:hypothetical protein